MNIGGDISFPLFSKVHRSPSCDRVEQYILEDAMHLVIRLAPQFVILGVGCTHNHSLTEIGWNHC